MILQSGYLCAHFTDEKGDKITIEVTLSIKDGRTQIETKISHHSTAQILRNYLAKHWDRMIDKKSVLSLPCADHRMNKKTDSLDLPSFLNFPRGKLHIN